MPVINIEVGPWLFSFRNFEDWVNNAGSRFAESRGYTSKNTIAVDKENRVCVSGQEMMRARGERAFPIRVYALVPRKGKQ